MKRKLKFFKVKGIFVAIFLIFATLHIMGTPNYYSVRAYNASPEAIQFLESNMEKVYYDRYGVPTYTVKLEDSNVLHQYLGIQVNFGVTNSDYKNLVMIKE
jgi:hypothetical protein